MAKSTPKKSARKSGPSPASVMADIKKGEIKPLYYLYGQEDFEREEIIRALTETVVEPAARMFNLDVFHADDMDVAQAVNQALTFPMMAQRRLVVFKRIERLPDAAARDLLPLVQSPPATTVQVFTADRPDARKKLFSELSKNAIAVEFRTPYDNEIPGWIQTRARALGRQIAPEAAHQLHLSVGAGLRELDSELGKLLIATEKDPISRDDVLRVVARTRGVTVFDLADALGHRRLDRAQHQLDRLLEQGENPVGVVAMLIRHFGILRKARWLQGQRLPRPELAAQLKVPPFFVNTYLEQVHNFDETALWQIFEALLQADNRLKLRSRIHHQTLSELIYRICRTQTASS